MKSILPPVSSIFLIIFFLSALPGSSPGRESLNFNRDIRPILSAKCFSCHGPDSQDRDADYRLDTREDAFADLGGYAAIVPGKPKESELIYRITTDDDSDLMPPPKHKNPLTPEEIDLLTRWIEEGAPYAGHWAFEPVARPELPEVKAETINPIDRFIAEGLEREGPRPLPKLW
ncbi:MAG: c-type cytochrome domain-containing protein [Verrucomicrobiota bacterium]